MYIFHIKKRADDISLGEFYYDILILIICDQFK